MNHAIARSLFAGLLYFALVFGVGFVLGTIRVLALVPMIGERTAELFEFPVMLLVSFVGARCVVQRLAIPSTIFTRLTMGAFALILLLAAEFGFVLWLRGISLAEYFETRDPLTATIYYLTLIIFAALPLIIMTVGTRESS